MHDIKFIRNNSEQFDESLEKRGIKACSGSILKIHDKYLSYLNQKQKLQEKKNLLSKSFSKDNEKNQNIQIEVKGIKKEIENLNTLSEEKFTELHVILMNLPNILDNRTPLGNTDEDNVVLKEVKKNKELNFKIKNHLEIAEALDLIDYPKAVKISGSRFSILKKELAILHRGLVNFLLDHNSREFNYSECCVPELVKADALEGTGQLPKFHDDLFKTNFNDLYLIPTSEVPLTNLHRETMINKKNLPIKYTAFTNCFRAEAGASGQDTKGLMREHQFGKVELVTISEPTNSEKELKNMIECVESILNKLDLPYRIIELCSADVGFSSSYTLDVELWMPGQDKYREVSSCSNCKDFQSRRMKMKVKDQDKNETYFPHTLNGSALAIGRLLIAIIENFQDSEGSIKIPLVLRPYLNGLEKIPNYGKEI